jgi:hypothetical protein
LKFHQIATSNYYDLFILLVVFVNLLTIIIYLSVKDKDTLDIIETIDTVLNVIYIGDAVLKIIAIGIEEYFSHFWYQFDFFMVCITLSTFIG